MNVLKRSCEKSFGRIAEWAFNHKWLALFLVMAVSVPICLQLPKITMDTSNESFFRADDRVLIEYNGFRDQFGKDEYIAVGIESSDIFSLEFLQKLRKFHQDMEEKVPFVEEVTSLVNIRNTRGQDDELIVEDFLEQWPKDAAELSTLKKRAGENSLYTNYVLSEDQQMTAIIIKPFACNPEVSSVMQAEGSCQPMSNEQNREMMSAIGGIVEQYNSERFPVSVSGMPAVIDHLNVYLVEDLAAIIPLIFIVVILFLTMLFRRVTGVVYPLIIFLLSLLSTIGLMAVFGIPMTNITTIIPSFILVVSISDAVHILALFYPAYQRSGSREQAIIEAMEHSGLAVLMTTLTTAGGFLSFVAAEIAPIADLGFVAPIGVFLALFYTVFLLPSLLAILPVKKKSGQQKGGQLLDQAFNRIAAAACSQRLYVIGVFLLLLVVAVAGVTKLRFSHNALKWFSQQSIIRQDTELIDRMMQGTVSMDVVIDTGEADGLYHPEFIHSLEQAILKYSAYSDQDLFVGKVIGLTTVLKETNRALHGNLEEFYTLPESRALIAQELFLFQLSGSDDLEELVDQQFSKTRLTMHLPYRDSVTFKKFVSFVENDLVQRFPDCQISVTGVNALFIEILNNVMTTMARSYTIAFVFISILMVAMLGKLRMGLLSMIPNLFPILIVMGLMGWLGIPLDFGTILVGSLAIGIVVDDTIHFLHNYGRYYDQTGSPLLATEQTLCTVGRAMLTTSVVLTGGFLCNLLSQLVLNQHTGFLIASTVVIALVTDFFLAPAMFSIVYTKKQPATDMLEVTT